MVVSIDVLDDRGLDRFDAHFLRHCKESGRGDYHFMPYDPDDAAGPRGLAPGTLKRGLNELGWERWWVAGTADAVIGHVNLKGAGLRTGLHRAQLGIGIERDHRGAGLGARLMETAIAFCRDAPELVWLDLNVFAHNANARALYERLGFEVIGHCIDRFRIAGDTVADVAMTLRVDQR